MKINALNKFEKEMLKVITKYHVCSIDEVEKIYRQFESYDKTIATLIWIMSYGESPQNYQFTNDYNIKLK